MRLRISTVAASVNVTASRREREVGLFSSVSAAMTRAVRTAVLPEPAAADRKTERSRHSIAARCAGV